MPKKTPPTRRVAKTVKAFTRRKPPAPPPGNGGGDAATLLRLALVRDPSSPEGKAALRAAEGAALRLARDLRARAQKFGGPAGRELEKLAQESYFQSVLARELPRVAEALRRQRQPQATVRFPTPPERPARPVPLLAPPAVEPPLDAKPDRPENVRAEEGVASARVFWQAPPQLVTSYEVVPRIGTADQPSTLAPGAATETTVLGLTIGTPYTFVVKATNPLGTSDPSDPSNEVTPFALPVGDGGPLDVRLPAFSSDPALLIDSLAGPFRSYVAEATRTGEKWRYEHLKAQAIRAAQESMQFEQHIAQLMAMAVSKVGTAEELLNETLIAAADKLQGAALQLTSTPEIESLIDPLGDFAAQSLLLPRLIAFLVETGPLNFWIGLFEAVISDLASVVPFVGGATSLGRTRKYLREVFAGDAALRAALEQAVRDVLARLDGEVDAMVAPLRAAVDQVIGGTRKAMADVFEAFDVPLLMTPSQVPGRPDVPDADPFGELYERLSAQVDRLAAQIKQRIEEALRPILEGDSKLFVIIVVTFLVLPILAFLIISLAGGPFSAALLAAAVLLAAEELLRLLVRWLTGPLLGKVDELKTKVVELVARLQQFFAVQADLVRNQSPETIMQILASELRQLRDFLPEVFLEESAALLEEARNVILRTASQLGLAAEQALGMENATAFEAVADEPATRLAPAPQLPGGRDPARLAGAALIRDIGRLEEQRTAIRDGKELELTHRLSLLRLLGNDPAQFALFRQRRELVVELTERDLIDRMFPGVYRALLKEVRVAGLFGAAPAGLVRGIPLTLTHLGESRTRIKRSANPAAPPLELPFCLPPTAPEFSTKLLGRNPRPRPDFPWDWEDGVLEPLLAAGPPPDEPVCPAPVRLEDLIRRAFGTLDPLTIGDYSFAFIVTALALIPVLGFAAAFDAALEIVSERYQRPCLEHLLESLERAVREVGLGLVDPASIVEAGRTLLEKLRWSSVMIRSLIPPDAIDRADEAPDLEPSITALAVALRNGFTLPGPTPEAPEVVVPGLRQVAEEAYAVATAAFRRRIARWGDATLEEDPDPQVRSLGFATLVRRSPAESVVFNLFPPGPAPATRADVPLASPDGPPLSPATSLQYRPLENRGVEGRILLRLETIGDDGAAQLSDELTDVLLEVTLRGCYDQDLARTVRSSRRQTASGLGIVSNLAAVPLPVAQPDSLVRIEAGTSELRTVHYSLRAHRDKTLQVWSAAVQVQPALTGTIAALLPGKAPLGRDAAFTPLQPLTSFVLALDGAAPPNTEASLLGLVGTLRVTPADLGFDGGILSNLDVLAAAELLELGIAVVPMPGGVRGEDDPLDADPLGVTLDVPAPLDQVLENFAGGAPLPERLKVSGKAAAPPRLADLFSGGAAMTLSLAEAAFDPQPLLYDVIFSLTFRVPVLEVGTRTAALV